MSSTAPSAGEKRPLESDDASWTPDKLSRKLQKKAKHRLAKGLGTLQECLAVYGAGARAELELKDNSPVLPVHEVQNLLLWMLTQGLGHMPQWVIIRNKPLLRGAVVVVVPAVDAPELSHAAGPGFTAPRLVRVPKVSSTAFQELLRVKLQKPPKGSAAAKAAQAAKAATAAATAAAAAAPSVATETEAPAVVLGARPSHGWSLSYVREFALSPREQHENGYPLVITPPEDDDLAAMTACPRPAAVELQRADESSEDEAAEAAEAGAAPPARTSRGARARLLGVDCEMCYAGAELQLARVAVVDEAL